MWRRLAAPAVAALVVFFILIGLGTWQWERLAWKEALIARVQAAVKAEPVAAPAPAPGATPEVPLEEYTAVEVRGVFDHSRELHLFTTLGSPRGRFGGIGYLVFTPLTTAEGWSVFVNRGFVPADRKAKDTRMAGNPSGDVTVRGLLRLPEARHWYSPTDDARANLWYTRDPAAFAQATGLANTAHYLVDAFADPALAGGLPQGGETILAFPNSHLGYAITWYGLALAVVAVFVAFARARLRGRGQA